MSKLTMAQMDFVPARAEDYEEVMSISGGIYKGVDYLPVTYHEWLKDHCRRMFVAKTEGKIVGFDSFLLVDGGKTAVVQGLRVASSVRGQGVAGLIQKYCLDTLLSEHPEVKRVRLTHIENPPLSLLKKYKVILTKAVVSISVQSNQREEVIKLLETLLDNLGQSNTCTVLENAEVLKLFHEPKATEGLLPGKFLMQAWLPLTPQESNLELLFEKMIIWMYSKGHTGGSITSSVGGEDNVSTVSTNTPSGFLSLGTPPFKVPYGDATYRFDIDMFGVDSAKAKIHALQQLKLCLQTLPAEFNILCFMYAEESLRSELNCLCEELTPFSFFKEQITLEMEI